MQQKNEDAGYPQEKFRLYECATCDKRFPYLYSFKDWQICTSMMYEKSLTCPFRTYLRAQINISDILERFSLKSCNKKMKTQETFKQISGHMSVQCVTNNFIIFTLLKTVKYVLQCSFFSCIRSYRMV